MRLRTDGIKALSCGFSGGKKVINFSNKRNRGRVCLLLTTFYIKDDNDNFIWVEVTFVTFFDAVATIDVLTASNNDVNFVETQTVHFA